MSMAVVSGAASSDSALFPWQEAVWARLLSGVARLPHALLLHGPEGGGKARFAEALAARLLCDTAQGSEFACGRCRPCTWLKSGNHPDFRLLVPESEEESESAEGDAAKSGEGTGEKKRSSQIRISQIRDLAEFMVVGPHQDGFRVVLLRPAEAMNVHTANSLLKLLEEPAPNSVLILVSHNLPQLLPTVRSRCRLLHFGKPDRAEALHWLKAQALPEADQLLALAGGMPLLATRMAMGDLPVRRRRLLAALAEPQQEDPLRLAAELEGWLKQSKSGEASVDMLMLVDWLQKWVLDLACTLSGAAPIFHPNAEASLAALGRRTALPALFACYNDLQRARAVARHPLNSRLFLEDMLLRYQRVFSGILRGGHERTQ